MKFPLSKVIDRIVQRMAYWIAYSCEANVVKFVEAEAVTEIANILHVNFPFRVNIKREVDYRAINPTIKQNQRADLSIFPALHAGFFSGDYSGHFSVHSFIFPPCILLDL